MGRVVHTSSVVALGPSEGRASNEETPRKFPPGSPYERTKELAEREVFQFVEKGLQVVLVLPSLVYGPSERFTRYSFNRFLYDFLRERLPGIPGKGERCLNVVYVDDVMEGHLLAMENGRSGERYILGGENVTPKGMTQIISALTGRKARLRQIPFSLAYGFAQFSEWQSRWTGMDPWINRGNLAYFGFDWEYFSQKAERELGYGHRAFREGIADTVAWLVKTGKLDKMGVFT